jgi:thiol-disulfide isomerase/thioredoxin
MNMTAARKAPSTLLGVVVAVGLLGSTAASLLAAGSSTPSVGIGAPELTGDAWLNVPNGIRLTLASRKGKVTILHFWTFDCINCKHNLPAYSRWQKQFAAKGVLVIGVHTPETEAEHNLANVIRKVKELGITYPVLVDSARENWKHWQQRMWPTIYLIDKRGMVRYGWEGELEYQGAGGEAKMTRLIEALVKE